MGYTTNLKKTKSVTWLPGWGLKLKGRLDSRNGQGVCDEYIERLYKRLAALEGNEVINAENALFTLRKEAAVILTEFSEKEKHLEAIPKDREGTSVKIIRDNRKNAEERSIARKSFEAAIVRLTEIRETINNVNTVLAERVNKIRNNAKEKIHAYVVGIRCGKLKDYVVSDKEYDNTAVDIYIKNHEVLDQKIIEKVSMSANKKEAA